jgi:hypothetical protein
MAGQDAHSHNHADDFAARQRRRYIIWAAAWGSGGALVGAVSGECLWQSMCYGDYGAGAWAGGMLLILMVVGSMTGVIHGGSLFAARQTAVDAAIGVMMGGIIGGIGSPALFVLLLLCVRHIFTGAGESLKDSGWEGLVIMTGSIVAAIGWGILGLALSGVVRAVNKGLGPRAER